MKLHELSKAVGSTHKDFRRGRGHGSGNGKTAGFGHKGQRARSGRTKPGFEGGQMPFYKRVPKRGMKCINRKEIVSINLSLLEVFEEGAIVDIEMLKSKGLISRVRDGVKILGNGELTKKMTIQVNFFSKEAERKIKEAGGKAEVI